ncbi:MAG TPA: hypothetical protein PKY01_15285 [Candidatus Hydrogenedentes bacterium]|nr:hypothetical protein [Candidatus Hydrogenedentota bacterium]
MAGRYAERFAILSLLLVAAALVSSMRETRAWAAANGPAVIPTPRSIQMLPAPARFFPSDKGLRILLCGEENPTARLAVDALSHAFEDNGNLPPARVFANRGVHDPHSYDVVMCGERSDGVEAMLPLELAQSKSLDHDQGYVIYSVADAPVLLYSRTSLGLLYAASTLGQVLEPAEKGLALRHLIVEDFPSFPFRGNNWNLFAEIGGWSYERGDGLVEYEKRLMRKLDLCARYKINVVIVDGVGWNADRFPGYADMMRRLNRAARTRGIHLCYTGYSAGYGPPPYHAPVFQNRREYPDGEVYACCGNPSSESVETTRTMGTCLSNRQLLAEKQENLVDFVRRVEPGMLYLHGLDINSINECEVSWAMRCPDCRGQWPSDSIFAADGMAGAYGWYYNALAGSVNEVKSDETDYDAARDCILYMISPNYTQSSESDAEWNAHLEYFTTLSRELHYKNIMIGLREQFCNQDTRTFRCREMRAALDREGSGVPFGVIHFYGGDLYDNNVPFLPVPLFNKCFEGVGLVLNGNGNAYQEPQQLLNAEYGWNPDGSAFLHMAPPSLFDEFRSRLLRLSSGEEKPAELFGEGAFLDAACRSLYGKEAGKWVAQMYRLEGIQPLNELSRTMYRPSVLLPVWNTLMPVGRFSTFRRHGVQWQRELGPSQWNAVRLLRDANAEMVELNRKAAELIARARAECRDPEAVRDLAWLESTLTAGGELASATAQYLKLFERAHAAAAAGSSEPDLEQEIETLERHLAAQLAASENDRTQPLLDHLGGDVGYRCAVLGRLRDELNNMLETLRSGVWPATPISVWW